MGVNQSKHKPIPNTEKKSVPGKSMFNGIENLFNLKNVFDQGVPLHIMPKIIWGSVLAIIYIANAHFAERKTREIDKLKLEVEDLRADFTTMKAEYMIDSKQSEVAKNIAITGIEESKNPPVLLSKD